MYTYILYTTHESVSKTTTTNDYGSGTVNADHFRTA